MTFSLQSLLVIFPIFVRAAALLSLIPMFGGRIVPRLVQIAFAASLAIIASGFIPVEDAYPTHFVALVMITAKELLTGLLMGFAVRLVFHVAEFAGSLISMESGLMRSDAFDPLLQSQSTTVSTVLFHLSTVMIFVTGVHHEIIEAFVLSYRKVPIFAPLPLFRGVEALTHATANVFLLGLRIAAPVVALSFVINVTFAVLGKAVPKMNVFIVSFPVKIYAGLSLLLLIIGLIVQYFHDYIRGIPTQMIEFLSF